MDAIIDFLNEIFWGYVLIYGLIGVGIYFTIRLRFLQFRHFGEFVRSVLRAPATDAGGITPFQALCTSLASRVGTGNLAGVAVALYLGGPGALFWMWVVALVGMATAYAESTLAQLYKIRDENGQFRGGPAFYMARGLRAPWAGSLFSVCLLVVFGLVFNAVQANSIAEAMEGAFGVPKIGVGIAVAVLTAVVIFGGIRKIAQVAEYVVPFMAGAYLAVALYVLVVNIAEVPAMLALIVKSAFGIEAAGGGVAGGMAAAMLNGVKRGLYSNEAGMGSAPNIAAAATPVPHHPASQGLVQSLGVFIDTLLICTATGLVILLSGVLGDGGDGVVITQNALVVFFGPWGSWFAAIALFFFAFTTILGNYAYAENGLLYLGGGDVGLFLLRAAALAVIVWGVHAQVPLVWSAADAAMAMMATLNLAALLGLSGVVVKLTRDYDRQLDAGRWPVFHIADYPELGDGVDHEIWRERD